MIGRYLIDEVAQAAALNNRIDALTPGQMRQALHFVVGYSVWAADAAVVDAETFPPADRS